MSSEEMRTELESFVNKGLREGWTGWPVKVDSCITDQSGGQWSAAALRGRFDDNSLVCATGLHDTFFSLHSLC